MTSEPEFEQDRVPHLRTRRPALYPLVAVPIRVANAAGLVLVGAAALIMIGSLIEALSYHQPSLSQEGLLGPATGITQIGNPANSFADRLARFTSGGAGLGVALLLVIAVAVIAMSARGDESDEEWFGWWRVVVTVGAVLAFIVALANVVMCVEVLRNASGEFIAEDSANKFSSIVGFLAPVVLSIGVVLYAAFRLRSSTPPDDELAEELDSDG